MSLVNDRLHSQILPVSSPLVACTHDAMFAVNICARVNASNTFHHPLSVCQSVCLSFFCMFVVVWASQPELNK